MALLLENGRIISPGVDRVGFSVKIEDDGKISEVGSAGTIASDGAENIDAEGLLILPGFVDVHCHGRGGADFCDAKTEAVDTIARGKLAEGVTTMLGTTLTLPENELADTLSALARYNGGGCRIPGAHLEGPFINPRSAGAQNPDFARKPDAEEVDRLRKIFPVRKVSFAPELEGAAAFVREMRRREIVPSGVHSRATYAEFLDVRSAGLRDLSHFCNQMSPLHHRDIGLVGAGLLDREIFCEFICDTLHISPPMIELVFQVKGCDRIELITDAMRASGMPDGEYTLGGLPVTVAGGAARLSSGGALAGSTLQFNDALRNVAEITKLPLKELVKTTSFNQAVSLGLQGIGRIETGCLGDVVILDREFRVKYTIVGGKVKYSN